jgi:protein phosphatase
MIVYVAVKCGIGKEECEDVVLVGDSIICDEATVIEAPNVGIACIADGVGGNAGGHFASTFVAEHIRDAFSSDGVSDLPRLLKDINTALIAAGFSNELPIAATTFTGIAYAQGKEFLMHIGNTRAYVLQGKYLKQLTSDHTVYNRLLKMGRISENDASNRNEITNCFGGGKESLFDSLVVMDIQDFKTLLLTSDGVHDYIGIDAIESLLTDGELGLITCKRIIQAALAAGSKDDISVVIMQK